MADNPIENFAANTTPDNADVYAIVNDPGGSPATQKITHRNLQKVVLTKDDWIWADRFEAPPTAPAAITTVSYSVTGNVVFRAASFDDGGAVSDENIAFWWHPPELWDGSTVDFALVWGNQAGLTTEVIDFDLAGHAYADNDALDVAIGGTPQNVTDTWTAQDDYQKTPFSASSVTLGGTPANGNGVYFLLTMDTTASTLTGDCEVLAVIIRYGITDNGST
jgi:hypothetical protein